MGDVAPLTGPDFTLGIDSSDVPEGSLLGHAHGEAVLLIRQGKELFAIGATCTHYSSSLKDGLITGETIRCPWHHATFDLRSGEAIGAPAFNPLPCWQVAERDGRITVLSKRGPLSPAPRIDPALPESIVIVGAGAAGEAAAEELRRRGFSGSITMIDADPDSPIDRPNLSKDNLAGTAPEEWLWLHPDDFYAEQRITRRTGTVTAIDRAAKQVRLADGTSLPYGRLLLATGASPVKPTLPGSGPSVYTVRKVADLRAIVKATSTSKRAVVLGASFIGLEVAASLRARGLEVHVVAPGEVPLGNVLGPQLGAAVRALHEKHGVIFHLGQPATGLAPTGVTLADGTVIAGDFVVAGLGVRPNLERAQQAGLTVERGIIVDEALRTSDPHIFAAGDACRYPDPRSSSSLRIEHWSVAQNQGRCAAKNLLGVHTPFRDVPYFWSQHYDVTIGYVGHAEKWDTVVVDGDPLALDCAVKYLQGTTVLAVATVNRDRLSLEIHASMEKALAIPGTFGP